MNVWYLLYLNGAVGVECVFVSVGVDMSRVESSRVELSWVSGFFVPTVSFSNHWDSKTMKMAIIFLPYLSLPHSLWMMFSLGSLFVFFCFFCCTKNDVERNDLIVSVRDVMKQPKAEPRSGILSSKGECCRKKSIEHINMMI